jgi:hypothetical protein
MAIVYVRAAMAERKDETTFRWADFPSDQLHKCVEISIGGLVVAWSGKCACACGCTHMLDLLNKPRTLYEKTCSYCFFTRGCAHFTKAELATTHRCPCTCGCNRVVQLHHEPTSILDKMCGSCAINECLDARA